MTDLPSQLPVFKIGEAAFLAQIGADTLRTACIEGHLRCYRSGVGPRSHRMILRESLVCWMNSCGVPLDISLLGTPRKCGRGSGAPADWYAYKRKLGGLALAAIICLGGCNETPVAAPPSTAQPRTAQPRAMVSQRTAPVVPFGEPCAPPVGEPIVWVDPCPGQVTCALPDLDNDGEVGINDFLLLLKLWGPSDCTLYRRGDINWDGQVDTADMLIILEVWDTYESATWNRCDC